MTGVLGGTCSELGVNLRTDHTDTTSVSLPRSLPFPLPPVSAAALIGPVLLFFTPLVMTVDLFVVGLAGVLYLALAHEMDDGDVAAAFQAQ